MYFQVLILSLVFGFSGAALASSNNSWSCSSKISSSFRNFLFSHNKDLDYAYGSGRKKVDLFYHRSHNRKTPVVVFFHGGGFRKGDKCNFFSSFESEIRALLNNNIAVASVNYSFLVGGDGRVATRSFDDGKAAFRKLKQISRWRNINMNRVVLAGRSAGAGIAMAIGLHQDYSGDVAGLLLLEAQASYSTHQFGRVFNEELKQRKEGVETFLRRTSSRNGILWHLKAMYGTNNSHTMFDSRSNRIARKLNLLHLMDSDDPPIYVENVKENDRFDERDAGNIYHHKRHADLIERDARRKGIAFTKIAGSRHRSNTSYLRQQRMGSLIRALAN